MGIAHVEGTTVGVSKEYESAYERWVTAESDRAVQASMGEPYDGFKILFQADDDDKGSVSALWVAAELEQGRYPFPKHLVYHF